MPSFPFRINALFTGSCIDLEFNLPSQRRNIAGSRGARKPFDNTCWVYVREELLYSDFRKIPQFFHQQSGLKKVIYPSSCSMQPSD